MGNYNTVSVCISRILQEDPVKCNTGANRKTPCSPNNVFFSVLCATSHLDQSKAGEDAPGDVRELHLSGTNKCTLFTLYSENRKKKLIVFQLYSCKSYTHFYFWVLIIKCDRKNKLASSYLQY